VATVSGYDPGAVAAAEPAFHATRAVRQEDA
jgi:hypothetical protein